jgi:glycosyltransferase involved in cell wall biosynthesis
MRVLIASTYVPFVRGGGTMILDGLESALRERGHEADSVRIPFRSSWPEIARQTVGLRCLDLTEVSGRPIDVLITVRYPSYAIVHPNKLAWFIHHHREAYDLWGTAFQGIPLTPDGRAFRQGLMRSDTRYLSEARAIYTNSHIVAARLKVFNGLSANGVLYPPHPRAELYRPGADQDFFVYSSRLGPIKRQRLAIEAMRHVRGCFRLKLVGAPDVGEYEAELRTLAQDLGVADKVDFLGWVTEEEKAELTANAAGALYIPYEEDSYGYSTLEAFHSHKPVITMSDSGGILEVVVDGANGLVVEPSPRALADGMDRLWANASERSRLGEGAYETLAIHNISWAHVVDTLLSSGSRP